MFAVGVRIEMFIRKIFVASNFCLIFVVIENVCGPLSHYRQNSEECRRCAEIFLSSRSVQSIIYRIIARYIDSVTNSDVK
jgi:hypothetical protein